MVTASGGPASVGVALRLMHFVGHVLFSGWPRGWTGTHLRDLRALGLGVGGLCSVGRLDHLLPESETEIRNCSEDPPCAPRVQCPRGLSGWFRGLLVAGLCSL